MSHKPQRRWMPLLPCALAVLLPSLSRAEPPAGDKYALLVGVHQYDKNELRDLPYAEADMTALADVLRQAGYKRVVLMTQSEGAKEARFLPMAANIRNTLKGMLEDLSPDESVLVAFAGHGIQYRDEDDNYFCPMDAKLADRTSLVSLLDVYKQLEKSPAGTRLLLADCCRNDPRSDNGRAADKVKLATVTRPQQALPPGGVAAFFSCSAEQIAYEDASLKHGVFFHFIIEGLQGKADLDKDGQVDLDELVTYTQKEVRDFVKGTYGDAVHQTPELVGKTRGQVTLARVMNSSEVTNAIGMKLEFIKPGKYLMGSPKEEEGRNNIEGWEGPQHEVEITKPFYMGVYPVTKGQFAQFVKDNGYQTEGEKDKQGGFGYNAATHKIEGRDPKYSWRNTGWEQTDDLPVVNVSWYDATAFCAWLSKKEGKTYELPTSAEWEYACRAGTTTRFWCGDADESLKGNANISDASLKEQCPSLGAAVAWDDVYAFTSPVGRFKANRWGLYDMAGNVFQWCADGWYFPYQQGSIKDPKDNQSANNWRAVRGGSWAGGPSACRSAYRNGYAPLGYSNVGFRVVLRASAGTP